MGFRQAKPALPPPVSRAVLGPASQQKTKDDRSPFTQMQVLISGIIDYR